MSLPRQVLPGAFYMITRRCSERRFLLRPDRVTNNAYLYCLIEAARAAMLEPARRLRYGLRDTRHVFRELAILTPTV